MQDFSCGDATDTSLSRRGIFIFDEWPLCLLFHSCPHPAPIVRDVCGVICESNTILAIHVETRANEVVLWLGNDTCNNNAGDLPPVREDCEQLSNTITIFNGIQCQFEKILILNLHLLTRTSDFVFVAPEFTTSPGHVTKLTFQTCSFFFSNLRKDLISYSSCWTDLVSGFTSSL